MDTALDPRTVRHPHAPACGGRPGRRRPSVPRGPSTISRLQPPSCHQDAVRRHRDRSILSPPSTGPWTADLLGLSGHATRLAVRAPAPLFMAASRLRAEEKWPVRARPWSERGPGLPWCCRAWLWHGSAQPYEIWARAAGTPISSIALPFCLDSTATRARDHRFHPRRRAKRARGFRSRTGAARSASVATTTRRTASRPALGHPAVESGESSCAIEPSPGPCCASREKVISFARSRCAACRRALPRVHRQERHPAAGGRVPSRGSCEYARVLASTARPADASCASPPGI